MAALSVGVGLGPHVLLWIFGIVLYGSCVLYLWSRRARAAKLAAVFLMPVILLVYLAPKNTRQAIRQVEMKPKNDAASK
jgi:apolipoprotein N-acyltransferase